MHLRCKGSQTIVSEADLHMQLLPPPHHLSLHPRSSASCTIFDNSVFAPLAWHDIWELRQLHNLHTIWVAPYTPYTTWFTWYTEGSATCGGAHSPVLHTIWELRQSFTPPVRRLASLTFGVSGEPSGMGCISLIHYLHLLSNSLSFASTPFHSEGVSQPCTMYLHLNTLIPKGSCEPFHFLLFYIFFAATLHVYPTGHAIAITTCGPLRSPAIPCGEPSVMG